MYTIYNQIKQVRKMLDFLEGKLAEMPVIEGLNPDLSLSEVTPEDIVLLGTFTDWHQFLTLRFTVSPKGLRDFDVLTPVEYSKVNLLKEKLSTVTEQVHQWMKENK